MKRTIYPLLLLVIGLSYSACSQNIIRPLTIGDTLPDITLHHLLQYKTETASISDFKGKALILDFFSTWCGSCIEALPEMERLQQQFSRDLQILVVDYAKEPPKRLKNFLKENPIGENISLPFVLQDTILPVYFPHKVIPHEIWIDKSGVIRAITSVYHVNEQNIKKLIAGESLDLPVKRDVLTFDSNKPLFVNGNGGDRMLYRSTLGKSIPGAGSSSGIQIKNGIKRLSIINSSILNMYNYVYKYGIRNRYLLHVKDSSQFIRNDTITPDVWQKANYYCYEIRMPADAPDKKLKEHLLADLNSYFGLIGRKEVREMSYWALVQTGESQKFKTKGGVSVKKLNKNSSLYIFKNLPLSMFIKVLNRQYLTHPRRPIIIDETNYTGNVDISIKTKNIHEISIPDLRKALQKYGLDLVPKEKAMEVFVLTQRKNTDKE